MTSTVPTPADPAVHGGIAHDDRRRGPSYDVDPGNIAAMFQAAWSNCPDRDAVVSDDGTVSYADFGARVGAVARLLIDRGVRVGDRVVVLAHRCAPLCEIAAGLIVAGAVYVPVDGDYPEERIRFITKDADPRLIVTVGAVTVPQGLAADAGVDVLDADSDEVRAALADDDKGPLADDALDREIAADDPVYLIYTSGTTGTPKGVVNGHRAVAAHLQTMARAMGSTDVRVLMKAPVGFDVGVGEILIPLATGGTVVAPPPSWRTDDLETFLRLMLDHKVTVMSLVPSLLRTIFDILDGLGMPPTIFSGIEELILGGEAVPGDLVTRARKEIGCRVWGLYGPSEASMDVTWIEFAEGMELNDGEHLIGYPEDNVVVYVLDADGKEVGENESGELYLAGEQLAEGYFRRPELTEEAFLPSLNPEWDGGRMYRTGDIVRWNEHNQLQFLGRIGDQVKIRGNRVELGEVEAALRGLDGVRHAAAKAHGTDVQSLIGYVVAEDGAAVDVGKLQKQMATQVPGYMVPGTIMVIDELPLGDNGKLDRAKLPTP
ncbi:amino acid adenylation domain-containing protein [Corynebacterium sp. TAE3-ERU12]|uniref:amino acid adenylation domain-containing protein n=1 Tax=Corynebacterium sp. TAE3-ERU12 TaxID=2849491 RepID=UPI001C469A60|nr:amino acid adenylation domain-containing protein [Corynebacterium sp. TAE3-ERU12]MBV7294640.1 amino acid adenylation domain-containing protein [Corynebacterium sp. TAE3-ERU12]